MPRNDAPAGPPRPAVGKVITGLAVGAGIATLADSAIAATARALGASGAFPDCSSRRTPRSPS